MKTEPVISFIRCDEMLIASAQLRFIERVTFSLTINLD